MDRADSNNARNLALIWCCQCATTLGLMAMVPIMPLYLSHLADGDPTIWSSAALAAPAVTALAVASRIGQACDRYGYRRLVLLSLTGFAISMALMALSTGILGFLLGRLLLGASGVGVTLTAFACAASSKEQRGRTLGLLQSASAFGSLSGPIIGGVLLDLWSLRPLLIAIALFCGIAVLFASWRLEEPCSTGAPKPSTIGPHKGWLSNLRDPIMRNWMFAACLGQAAAFAVVNVFVSFLEPQVPPASLASATGAIHAAGWAASMLASPLWGRKNDTGDVRRHFFVAAVGCAASVALLPMASNVWQILALRIAQGACFAALAQSVFLSLSKIRSADQQGASVGLAKSYLVLGQIVGPAVVAALLPWCTPGEVLWGASALFGLAAFFALRVPKASQPAANMSADCVFKIAARTRMRS